MTFLRQTLTLSTVGASLITSNSFWFFEFFGIHPIQDNSIQISEPTLNSLPPIQPSLKKSTADMNGFRTAFKHKDITGSSSKDENLKTGIVLSGIGVEFTLEGLPESKNIYMSGITSRTMEDFTLTRFTATEEQYKNFSKEEIKIKLFKNPAWYSSTDEDEYYQELEKPKIEDLFKDQDETKVKQLLLSLNKGLRWKKLAYDENEKRTKYHSELFYSSKLDDLKDLKIKYFKDFDSLKNYVHTKISTCIGEEIACIADYKELNVMETDQPSFFENLEKTNNR